MTDPNTPPPAPPAGAAPDLPPVPRPGRSTMATVLGVIAGSIVSVYAAFAWSDIEPGSPKRDEIPASVRSSPGGYRSFHFWHSGYHGGK